MGIRFSNGVFRSGINADFSKLTSYCSHNPPPLIEIHDGSESTANGNPLRLAGFSLCLFSLWTAIISLCLSGRVG